MIGDSFAAAFRIRNIRHIRFLRHTAQDHLRDAARPVRSGCGDDRCDLCCHRDRVACVSRPALRTSPRRRRGAADDSDPADRFSDSMRIVRHGTAPLLDQDLEEIAAFEVSTPQTRRAAVNDLRRLERLAAARRRRVLLGADGGAQRGDRGLCRAADPVVEHRHPRRPAVDLRRGRPDQRSGHADEA